MTPFEDLQQLKNRFAEGGAERLLAKVLAPNDNSKQQVYLGGSWEAVRMLPVTGVAAAGVGASKHFAAALRMYWVDRTRHARPAPHAKLILYPQYPEVRFSGFLRGVVNAPKEVMTSRAIGRVLFFGLTRDGTVLAYVAAAQSRVAHEAKRSLGEPTGSCPLVEVPFTSKATPASERRKLLRALKRICERGWIDSKQLSVDGTVRSCEAQNCGGLTLEAELGVAKNSRAEADYAGWEVKQFAATTSTGVGSGRITLMTPEPNGGVYAEKGADAFVRRYGYGDVRGRANRINFGGNFVIGRRVVRTGLTLALDGFDLTSCRIIDASGRILLVDDSDAVAASWSFVDLMAHWARKHQRAAYITSRRRLIPRRQYSFGPIAHLAEGTDLPLFLSAVARGGVVYDPGMKLFFESGQWKLKRRSQFRATSTHLRSLYSTFQSISLLES